MKTHTFRHKHSENENNTNNSFISIFIPVAHYLFAKTGFLLLGANRVEGGDEVCGAVGVILTGGDRRFMQVHGVGVFKTRISATQPPLPLQLQVSVIETACWRNKKTKNNKIFVQVQMNNNNSDGNNEYSDDVHNDKDNDDGNTDD